VLQLNKGIDPLPCRFLRLSDRIEPVHYLERIPLADDYRPLDDAFQFPHVAGPVIVLKVLQGTFDTISIRLPIFLLNLATK